MNKMFFKIMGWIFGDGRGKMKKKKRNAVQIELEIAKTEGEYT
jgi:hypothetical protein